MQTNEKRQGLQAQIIQIMSRGDDMTSVEIAEEIGIETKFITNILKQLEYAGKLFIVGETMRITRMIPLYNSVKRTANVPKNPQNWLSSLMA